jgi:hypothetical protein
MLSSLLLAGISLLSVVSAAVIPPHDTHTHDNVPQGVLPDRWYHPEDHPAHALFRRQAPTPAQPSAFPEVGSSTWAAAYPASTPDSSAMPQAWIDALNIAVQAGKIPNIPVSQQSNPTAGPTYGSISPTDPSICSASYGCRIPGQWWDAPNGTIGISFDDGPLAVSSPRSLECISWRRRSCCACVLSAESLANTDRMTIHFSRPISCPHSFNRTKLERPIFTSASISSRIGRNSTLPSPTRMISQYTPGLTHI